MWLDRHCPCISSAVFENPCLCNCHMKMLWCNSCIFTKFYFLESDNAVSTSIIIFRRKGREKQKFFRIPQATKPTMMHSDSIFKTILFWGKSLNLLRISLISSNNSVSTRLTGVLRRITGKNSNFPWEKEVFVCSCKKQSEKEFKQNKNIWWLYRSLWKCVRPCFCDACLGEVSLHWFPHNRLLGSVYFASLLSK